MNKMPPQRWAVPAYFHPDGDAAEWAQLSASGVALVVANVADGPGLVREESWAATLDDVGTGGSDVVGYVSTGYLGLTGLRTRLGSTFLDDWLSQILNDVNTWYALYGDIVTGIFFDQVTESEDGASIAPVFRRLRDHVHHHDPNAVIVLNAGAALPVSFADLADVVVTFEGPCEAYLGSSGDTGFEPLTWHRRPGQAIWHIVHDVPDAVRAGEVVALRDRKSVV